MKWILFRYSAYKARLQLTTIDWNFHINLPQSKTASGGEILPRNTIPRTRQWDHKVVKVEKGYEYIPTLLHKIFKRRLDDDDDVGEYKCK